MKSWMKAAGPHSWEFMEACSAFFSTTNMPLSMPEPASHCRFRHVYPVFYSDLTCVFESGRSQGTVPFRLSSAILALSLWARTMVRGMHSSVSSVAYPNIRPCPRSTSTVKEQHFIFWRRKNWCFSPELKCKRSDDLVSSSDFGLHAIDMNSLSDVRWLLLQSYQHVTGLIIKSLEKQRKKKKWMFSFESISPPWNPSVDEVTAKTLKTSLTFLRVIVTNMLDDFSHHSLVVHVGSRRDLPTEQHHARLTHRLCFIHTQDTHCICVFMPSDVNVLPDYWCNTAGVLD